MMLLKQFPQDNITLAPLSRIAVLGDTPVAAVSLAAIRLF